MGPVLLIASLWCIVLVYWLWTRRPALGDSVGSFRYELFVLEHATPARVEPANRRRPGAAALGREAPYDAANNSDTLLVAARTHKRQELQRRRRDVIEVLVATVLLSMLVALLTRSALALFLQAFTDLALLSYVFVLIRRTRVQHGPGYPGLAARAERWVETTSSDRPYSGAVEIGETAEISDVEYTPDHDGRAVRRMESGYGDFGSYASLAGSRAN
jgi:hypothetical protein